MRIFLKERKVDGSYDAEPSIAHLFHYDISKRIVKGKKVLDVGCWTGQYIGLMAPFCQAIGVDVNQKAINFARRRYPQVKFRLASVFSLPFKGDSFDVVTFWDVIEHLPRGTEKKALLEIKRVLKNSGRLFLSTVNDCFFSKAFDPAYFLQGHRHYSEKQLREFFSSLGFRIEKSFYTGGIFRVLYSNYELFCKHILKRKVMPIKFMEKRVKDEFYQQRGFDSIYLEANLTK